MNESKIIDYENEFDPPSNPVYNELNDKREHIAEKPSTAETDTNSSLKKETQTLSN